ncbi:MAG: DUF4190 domain-containing protein [Streptosporangiaceae bacterium]
MSYGHPPNDPYGQQDPYGWMQPQNQPGGLPYQQQPYQHLYGPYGYQQPASNGSAVAALICNILLVFCCLLGVPGIVLAALAMGKVTTEPDAARKLTMWSWICFGAAFVVGVLLVVLYVVVGISASGGGDGGGTYQRA